MSLIPKSDFFSYCVLLFFLYINATVLLFNCFGLYFFRKWIGPLGMFIFSSINIIFTLFLFTISLFLQHYYSVYWFLDLGRVFFFYDLIDSNILLLSDNLSLTTGVLVLFLTLFAQYFGVEYMYREAFIIRLVYLLNFFSTSVLFLFFVYDFFLILIVWELIGLFSLLLVNFYSARIYTIKAAFKTFLFSRFSDFFLFLVFFILILSLNSTDLSVIFLKLPFFLFFNIYIFGFGINLLNLTGFFLVIASGVKAAQFAFHVWLPDAMEAPTPASALIHSSTLVIMGIYLIIRFNVLFEFSYLGNLTLMIMGGLTVALGAISASFQNDIKKLVAYSTVSQMGYLFCGCGFLAYKEVLFYLAVHALNKAFLFILVGYIVHFFTGNTDLRFMGSFYNYSLNISFILIIISLNLTGLPFTSGFLAKEFLVFQTFKDDWFSLFTRVTWFFSFFLTPFYMLFLNWFVVFKTKQTFIKTVLNQQPLNFFYKSNHVFIKNLNSPVIAKTTSIVLLLFFIFIQLSGESLILVLFNNYNTLESTLSSSFSNYSSLVSDNLFNTSLDLINNLSFLILVSLCSAIKYLYNLSNC